MASSPHLPFPGDQGESLGVPGSAGVKGERGGPGFPGEVALGGSFQEYKVLEIKLDNIAQSGAVCDL